MEATQSWLEVYQPVIVGLGAVVLGLIANGLLEWWRAELVDKRQTAKVRKAMLIELMDLRMGLKANKNTPEQVHMPISRWLIDCDREKIGNLSANEVRAVANVISQMRAILTIAELSDVGMMAYRDLYILKNDTSRNTDDFIEVYAKHISTAIGEFEKRI